MRNFPPVQTRPYYIVAPSYTSKSAGVVTLYNLCHFLNKQRQRAYMVPMGVSADQFVTNPYLNAPQLTAQTDAFYRCEGVEPVVVYPDVTLGNPLGAKSVARFLLHYPGAYGGSKVFPETDHVWSFSPHIASFTTQPTHVLSVPNLDLNLFKLPPEGMPREGGCFYANKYLGAGNALLPITDGMTQLKGTHAEIAAALQRAEVCYVYENTSVISEAVLCGCRVVLVRSGYFNDVHSLETQTKACGVRWSDQDGDMAPLEKARDTYFDMCAQFGYQQLPWFIAETQKI